MRTGRLRSAIVILAAASLSLACGDYGGSSGGNSAAPSDGFLNLSAPAGGVDAFSTTVYPLLRQYCAACHEGNGPGSPHFAQPNVGAAYQALTTQGKVNLAMSYGLPVVATPASVEGMRLMDGEDVLVAENAEAFAAAVQRVYDDRALWEKLSAGGRANVERHFSRDVARAALRELLFERRG